MNTIYLDRLTSFIGSNDPWEVGFDPSLLGRVRKPNLEMYSTSKQPQCWTALDHARRIRTIMGNPDWYNDPIHLDNDCDGNRIYPIPIILDGWHRYFAHVATGDNIIKVIYGGRVDLLRYLEGKRKTCPQD